MRKTAQNGFSLIQLLLVIVMISVISTAFWNLQISRTEASYAGYRGGTTESSVKMALEDIKYHIGLAGYDLEKGKKPLKIVKGDKSDRLTIWHNDVCFEFYVDKNDNLIKKIENTEKIIAENVNSLKTTKVDHDRVAVTLSTVSMMDNDQDKIETLSKSYSTVVEMRNLL
ncbi:MAG: type II secretion system protein [Candidatus Zixiibacteriota bacterium]|nr:MAG: type II secretion system protein [candidate division Zixibacteria bacterium]